MADYVAGRGTTAMSILGTVLGSIGTAGSGLNLLGANPAAVYENSNVCVHDAQMMQELAQKDAQISRLESEMYSWTVSTQNYKKRKK